MKQDENSKQSVAGVTIKTEPGTSTNPVMQRLPSLRPPRDLSLSAYTQKIPNLNLGKNKKIYVPNLNVQRNKTSEAVTVKTEPVRPNLEKSDRERVRAKKNLVQLTHGLFADGIPGGQKNIRRGPLTDGGGGKADSILRKPTLKLKENLKVDKQEEEDTMKQLLRDDFVDNPTLEPDYENCPITLPLLNCKTELGFIKKSELKPVDKKENITMNDVFCDAAVPDPGFIFIQLPNSMPGLVADSHDGPRHSAQPQASSSSSQPTESKSKSENERCLLTSLPDGRIGSLQILKSGRARLVFGDTKMWLEMGTQVSFKQDLVSVPLDKETHSGHMINLGPVNVRMVATPDCEAMMRTLKTEKPSSSV